MPRILSKKLLWILLATVAIMSFVVGCTSREEATDVGSYTWLRDGSDIEDTFRFSVDELESLTIDTVVNSVIIRAYDGSEIVIEYVPDELGTGNFYHHVILPRYQLANGHLEIFRDVNLAPNTFIRGGTLNVFVPTHRLVDLSLRYYPDVQGSRLEPFSFENVSITTTGRDVVVADLSIDGQLSITTNGDINITNVDADFDNARLTTTRPNGITIN